METTYHNCTCEGCNQYREEKMIPRQLTESQPLVDQYLKQQGYATEGDNKA